MGELSLVLFTVLSQLAVGIIVTLWIIECVAKPLRTETGKMLTLSAIGITSIAMLLSLAHLGQPAMAFLALSNVANSWLSREIAMFSLFLLASLFYFLQWKMEGKQRKLWGGIASFTGTLGVIFSGMIYILPSMPAWNNFSPVLFFLTTAILLGPVFVLALLQYKKEIELPSLPLIVLAGIVISVTTFVLYITSMQAGLIEQHLTATNVLASGMFWLRVVIGWIVPIAIFGYYLYKNQKMNQSVIATAFILLLIGELVARELFYSAIVGMQVGL